MIGAGGRHEHDDSEHHSTTAYDATMAEKANIILRCYISWKGRKFFQLLRRAKAKLEEVATATTVVALGVQPAAEATAAPATSTSGTPTTAATGSRPAVAKGNLGAAGVDGNLDHAVSSLKQSRRYANVYWNKIRMQQALTSFAAERKQHYAKIMEKELRKIDQARSVVHFGGEARPRENHDGDPAYENQVSHSVSLAQPSLPLSV